MCKCFVGEAVQPFRLEMEKKKKAVCGVKDWQSWMTTLISISSKHSLVLWGHLVWLLWLRGVFMHNPPFAPVRGLKTRAYGHTALEWRQRSLRSRWSTPPTPKWRAEQIKLERARCLTKKWLARSLQKKESRQCRSPLSGIVFVGFTKWFRTNSKTLILPEWAFLV